MNRMSAIYFPCFTGETLADIHRWAAGVFLKGREAMIRFRGFLSVFDGEGAEQIRHDYWRTVTELFENAYMKQLYEWCGAA